MNPFSIFRPLYCPITLQEAREKELLQAQFALLLAQSDLDHARATVSYNEARVERLVLAITAASVLSPQKLAPSPYIKRVSALCIGIGIGDTPLKPKAIISREVGSCQALNWRRGVERPITYNRGR
jgi:hypothetical protein